MRKLIPAILVCAVVLLVGVLPLVRAAATDTEALIYTTDVSGGAVTYGPVKPGRSLCVSDAELPAKAREARVFVRTNRPTDVSVRVTARDAVGRVALARTASLPDASPGEHQVSVPVKISRTIPVAQVCVRNDTRRPLEIGAGQTGSVGYQAAPTSPLLRVDVLAGPPVPRVERMGHAIAVATLFKGSIVGRGLLISVAAVALLAALALVVVVARRTHADREDPT